MNTLTHWITKDQQYLWHPYTQHGLENSFLPVARAKNAWLYLEDNTAILDAISSWWVNLHGHAHPEIAQALYQQALTMEHTLFGSFTHQPAIELAEILIQAAQKSGSHLTRCFYSDNGATAVEIALKIAFQYHKNQGVTERTKFLALTDAYHGDTLGSMTVSARDHYHLYFNELLPEADFISPIDIPALENQLKHEGERYAALILEPLVQGAGGMKMYSPECLRQIAALCKHWGILLICDEVFTGFYRTGSCFAFSQAGIQPDLLCLAKGLTGGFLPMAATLATESIFSAYCSDDVKHAFLHGHSFTANPLGCAAGLASWKILQKPETQRSITRIAEQTQTWIDRLSSHPQGVNARCLGTIGVIEKKGAPGYLSHIGAKIRAYAIQHGVLIRPLGSVLYAVPPYCTTQEELDRIYTVIQQLLDEDFS